MYLELLENHPQEQKNKKPLLFIHGMWHAAWCYNEYFLPELEKQNIKAYALSLSNHGKSDKLKNINFLSIKQYVKDVERVIVEIGQEPLLVGHSMGGFVVQKFLEKHSYIKAILLAPVPPYGIWDATFKVIKHYPLSFLMANLTLNLKRIISNKKLFKKLMFTTDYPFGDIAPFYKQLDNESFGAYLGMLGFNLVNTKNIHTEIVLIGGEKDGSVSLKQLNKTAKKYETKPIIIKNAGHDLMLVKEWREVLEVIVKNI